MYKKILQQHNISVTKQRVILLEILDKVQKPITIEEIRLHIKGDINVTTIYRSLKRLVDVGIIYQTDFRDGVSYFEFQGDNHHHHITCVECKSRDHIDICITDESLSIAEKKGYSVTNHIFELFGLCKECSKQS